MGAVRLYAISIAEVRGIFGASPEQSTWLRAVAADRFGEPAPAAVGLRGRLGPVLRRPPEAPVIRPGVPSGSDVETILTGHHVPPHRLDACWTLLEAWIDALAWDSIGNQCTEAQLNDFDFALVTAEVPSQYSLRNLLKTGLEVALLPAPELMAGWVSSGQVRRMAEAWRPALPRIEASQRPVAEAILAWLDRFPAWAAAAPAQHREPPDLVAILRA